MARKKKLFEPGSSEPFALSRTKVELFMKCPRCFYLDRRLGIPRPPGFPFNLNSAVDALLKDEFDAYRSRHEPHPYMTENGINAIPVEHESLTDWRNNFRGVRVEDTASGFIAFGAIDDLWMELETGQYIVVDYKATSKNAEVTLDQDWQITYKRQMEFYQWLIRRNGYDVSDTGYFVYTNGRRDVGHFEDRVEFRTKVLPYTGSDGWVSETLLEARDCLSSDEVPDFGDSCDYCRFVEASVSLVGGG